EPRMAQVEERKGPEERLRIAREDEPRLAPARSPAAREIAKQGARGARQQEPDGPSDRAHHGDGEPLPIEELAGPVAKQGGREVLDQPAVSEAREPAVDAQDRPARENPGWAVLAIRASLELDGFVLTGGARDDGDAIDVGTLVGKVAFGSRGDLLELDPGVAIEDGLQPLRQFRAPALVAVAGEVEIGRRLLVLRPAAELEKGLHRGARRIRRDRLLDRLLSRIRSGIRTGSEGRGRKSQPCK